MHLFRLSSLFFSLVLLFGISGYARVPETKPLQLVASVFGGRQIELNPSQYPLEVTNDFYQLDSATQARFLELRREKLTTILKTLRGRLLESHELPETPSENWLSQRAQPILVTLDSLLFKNSRLLTSPERGIGTLYTAQAVAYWGLGSKVKGLGIELSLLRETTPDGKIKTTLSIESIKVLRAYMPIPVASAGFRVIRFNSISSPNDTPSDLHIEHFPMGPIASSGQNHLGFGVGGGLAVPPAPLSTITGFTSTTHKRKVLWSCESLLEN